VKWGPKTTVAVGQLGFKLDAPATAIEQSLLFNVYVVFVAESVITHLSF